ncbi:phytanoyl-CoA dioxygenase family protein [Streptomyces sp. B21-105]|uniref:phytanoyl-CoA dioxygenase family protein n=1 Tax=Streptomyces sp. B21-105 TaxID=3039417 RepID=UPI002FF01E13
MRSGRLSLRTSLSHRIRHERQIRSLHREYAQLRSSAATTDSPASILFRDGLAVLPEFFDAAQVDRMRAAVPSVEECRLSPEGTLTRFYSDAATIPELSPFFACDLVTDTMRTVLGPRVAMHRSTVQYRIVEGHTGAFEHFFHIDSWRPRYKAFLYLCDVTEANGPFTYIPGTHFGTWRRRYDRDIARVFQAGVDGYIHDEASAYVGCLWPHEEAALCARLHTEPRTVTGKAGTLILFDARGLHRIRPLVHAPRIILSSYWIREGQHT